ncbi:MAG: Insertion element protein [Actinomycetota bacterium]|nr:Insertion element protein [Actinomycetota bacterium]
MTDDTPGRTRQLPLFHCPYCGDEDLTPYEETGEAWTCRSCLRAFTVRLIATGVQPE